MPDTNNLDFSRRNWLQMLGAAAAAGAGVRLGLAAPATHSEVELPAIKSPLKSVHSRLSLRRTEPAGDVRSQAGSAGRGARRVRA